MAEHFWCGVCGGTWLSEKDAQTCAISHLQPVHLPRGFGGGIKHDGTKAPLSMLPPAGLEGAARVFEFGAQKYGTYNFMGGFAYTRLTSAALRHLFAWIWGQDKDEESGQSHLHHCICCLLMLCQIIEAGTGTDDRYKAGPKT